MEVRESAVVASSCVLLFLSVFFFYLFRVCDMLIKITRYFEPFIPNDMFM